jgi:alcohol dehydrogenase (cytochrome c)
MDKRVPVWNYSLNNSQGQESQPIVHDGVMYVTTHTSTGWRRVNSTPPW